MGCARRSHPPSASCRRRPVTSASPGSPAGPRTLAPCRRSAQAGARSSRPAMRRRRRAAPGAARRAGAPSGARDGRAAALGRRGRRDARSRRESETSHAVAQGVAGNAEPSRRLNDVAACRLQRGQNGVRAGRTPGHRRAANGALPDTPDERAGGEDDASRRRAAAVISAPSASNAARSITFASSRIFPGHACRRRTSRAPGPNFMGPSP